jgi:hypothetical protein
LVYRLICWTIIGSSPPVTAGTPATNWTEEELIKNVVKFTLALEGYYGARESQQHFCQNVAYAVVLPDGDLFAAAYPNNGNNSGDNSKGGLTSVPPNFTIVLNHGSRYGDGTENFEGNFIDVVYRSAGGTNVTFLEGNASSNNNTAYTYKYLHTDLKNILEEFTDSK